MGEIIFPDESRYFGNFFENNIEGYGTMEWKDNSKYEGYFKQNKL